MTMLLRRVFALALTVATMSAPLALALCHVECADAVSSRDRAVHHSCHESSEPGALTLSAVPHVCGHTNEAPPAGLERAQQTVTAPVAVLPSTAWSPALVGVPLPAPAGADTSPPKSQRLIQLRV
jgi:hypothetical protein